jgi:hypothetical protein
MHPDCHSLCAAIALGLSIATIPVIILAIIEVLMVIDRDWRSAWAQEAERRQLAETGAHERYLIFGQRRRP